MDDVIVCFITAVPRSGPAVAHLPSGALSSLEQPSAMRFGEVATSHSQVITGSIGRASSSWLAANTDRFLGVFGFAAATAHGPAPNAG